MFRNAVRGFIHGFILQSYKTQILCLAISDLCFVCITIYFFRSFYHKLVGITLVVYNKLLFILDISFYLDYKNIKYF
jgi:hypothetical protein